MVNWYFVAVELAKRWRGNREERADEITTTAISMKTLSVFIHSLIAFQLKTPCRPDNHTSVLQFISLNS